MSLKNDVQQLRFPSQKATAFYRQAAAFIEQAKATGGHPLAVVRTSTEEWNRWQAYFTHLGWEPTVWTMVRRGMAPSATLPCQWPEWFDTDFALTDPVAAQPPAARPQGSTASFDRLQARFGKEWGLGHANRRELKPLPLDRIAWRGKPRWSESVAPEPATEDVQSRLERLKATPIADASPELLKAIAERDRSHAA